MPYGAKARKKLGSQTTLYVDAKTIADLAMEDAVRIAEALTAGTPVDGEELDEWDQFNILMITAAEFSPGYWDDPDALTDLYQLQKKFTGREQPELLELARVARVSRNALPDPYMTPENPDWEKRTS